MDTLRDNKKIVNYLLSMIAFLMPFSLLENSISIAIIITVFYCLFLTKNIWKFKDYNISTLLPISYFLIIILSLLYTDNLSRGFKEIEKVLPFIVLPFIFWKLKKLIELQKINQILNFFIAGNTAALTICIINASLQYQNLNNSTALLKGSFYFTKIIDIHPTYLSMYLIMGLVILKNNITKHKQNKNYKKFTYTILIIIFFLLNLVHLRSRMALFALAIISLIYLFHNAYHKISLLKKNYSVFIITILLLFTGLFAYNKIDVLIKKVDVFLNRDISYSMNERVENWDSSLEAASNSILFGYGIGDSKQVRDTYFYKNGFDEGIAKKYNSHNQLIETQLSIGIIGIIPLLLMYLTLILFVKNNKIDIIYFCLLTLLLMSTESILSRQHGIIFFVFFYLLFNLNYETKKY